MDVQADSNAMWLQRGQSWFGDRQVSHRSIAGSGVISIEMTNEQTH